MDSPLSTPVKYLRNMKELDYFSNILSHVYYQFIFLGLGGVYIQTNGSLKVV